LHVRAQGYETKNLSTGAISTIKDQEEVSPIVLAKKAPAEATKETGRLRLRVVDEEGKPVDIASVQIWKQRPEGGAHAETVLAVSTDTPGLCETEPIPIGRYQALSIQVEGWAPFRQADVEVRRGSSEVITCRLSRGGTIQGVVTDEKGRPVAGLPVVVNSILCRRDLTTDPDGRFEASHLPDTRYAVTVEPPPESPYATAILQGGASCGAKDVHLVVKRKTEARASLVGTNIWQAGQLTLPVEPSAGKGKMILLCLFDMGQRPSRNCLQQLGRRAPQLNERGVVVVAAQAAAADRTQLDHWIKENNIVLPIGMMRDDPGRTLVAWGVQSLPWLILTDSRHVVRAEGFSLDELEAKTQGEDEHEKP
jgi:hypothetical protein